MYSAWITGSLVFLTHLTGRLLNRRLPENFLRSCLLLEVTALSETWGLQWEWKDLCEVFHQSASISKRFNFFSKEMNAFEKKKWVYKNKTLLILCWVVNLKKTTRTWNCFRQKMRCFFPISLSPSLVYTPTPLLTPAFICLIDSLGGGRLIKYTVP